MGRSVDGRAGRSGPAAGARAQRSPGRDLGKAVATAVVLLALVAGSYAAGPPAFFALVVVVILVALFELLDGLVQGGHRVSVPFGLVAGAALLGAAYAQRPALVGGVLIATAVGAFVLALRPGRGDRPASGVAWTVLGVTWVGGGGAAATGILVLPDGLRLVVVSVVVIALNDIAAYFAGSAFGRHRMAPSISAAKSWEGFTAGLAAAVAAGAALGALIEPLHAGHGVALGAICGVLGPAGDLAESLFKREVGIKDSGRLLPGHGGVLDRLDAIIFCAPAVFLYFHYVLYG